MAWIGAGLGSYQGPVDVTVYWTNGEVEMIPRLPSGATTTCAWRRSVQHGPSPAVTPMIGSDRQTLTAVGPPAVPIRVPEHLRFLVPGVAIRDGFLQRSGSYVALGHLVLSFNRSLLEIGVALVACCALDMLYAWVSSRRLMFPLSALISGLGLAILFTSPGAGWLMLAASWLTISSKYLVTWRGRHVFNPTNFALVVMILVSGGKAAIAPAYQWGGSWEIICVVFALGLVMMWRVNKLPLVLSFWAAYAVIAVIRSRVSGIPVEILLWASVSGGAFMLYCSS